MDVFNSYLQAVIAMLAITNPVSALSVFIGITEGASKAERRKAAATAALASGIILVGAALFGMWVLDLFGVNLPAFRAAGGLIILLIGMEMLRGSPSKAQSRDGEDGDDLEDRILVPLTMPMVAGPGSIATVMTIAAGTRAEGTTFSAVVAAIVAVLVLWVVLSLATPISQFITKRAERIFLRFMGLILIAIGIQMGLTGARAFFVPTDGDEAMSAPSGGSESRGEQAQGAGGSGTAPDAGATAKPDANGH